MGIADLPDIDEEDWNSYQADQFTASTRPASDALAFESFAAQSYRPIDQAREDYSQPIQLPPSTMMQGPPAIPIMGGGQDGYGQQGMNNPTWQPMFMGQEAPVSDLFSRLDGMDGMDGMAQPQQAQQPGIWSGIAPGKPNVFSAIGQEAQRGANALRASGATQTPIIGGLAGGAAQGAANIFNSLGGSAESLRQGDVLGGIGGAANVALNPGEPFRAMATELQAPTQIFSGIDPETPVLGGLNNPRELAGLIPEMLLPASAAERVVERGIGAVAKPVLSPVLDAARRGVSGIQGALIDGLYPQAQALGAASVVGAPGRHLTREANASLSTLPEGFPVGANEAAQGTDVFYSKLDQAIDRLPARGSPEQMRKTLLAQGVKPEELEWTGVGEHIASMGDDPVTRQDLRTVFDANQVEVREVVRGAPQGEGTGDESRAIFDQFDDAQNRLYDLREERERISAAAPTLEGETAWEDAVARANDLDAVIADQEEVVQVLREQLDQSAGVLDEATSPQFPMHGAPRPEDPTYREFEFIAPRTPEGRVPLVEGGTHWPEKNVIAHARTIDETLPDGRKALVVLEAQSDIHQRGRRLGYQADETEVDRLLWDEANQVVQGGDEAAITQWINSGDNAARRAAAARTAQVDVLQTRLQQARQQENQLIDDLNASGRAIHGGLGNPELQALQDQTRIIHDALLDAEKRRTVAYDTMGTLTRKLPFSKNWEELVMKRMLHQAAKDGYDVLAWSDAAWQGDVNNVGRSIMQIAYSPQTRELNVLFDDGQEALVKDMFPENMHGFIGRPLTRELLSRPVQEGQVLGFNTSLAGPVQSLGPGDRLDLLGDATEQYRVFYDQKLRQIADKLAKPFGGKAQENLWTIDAPGSTKGFMGIHGIEITPALREGVQQQGFPLFAKQAGRAFESPFFSPARTAGQAATDIAVGTAGGAAAAATTPPREGEEEARWEDRLGRFAVGAGAAALGPGGLRALRRGGDNAVSRAAAGGAGGADLPPPLRPDEDAMPPAEPAGDVIARVLAEMSPTGKAAAQRYGSEVAHRAPWMEGIVSGTERAPTGDAARYEDILALTTGDTQAADDVGSALDAVAEADRPYAPPRKMTSRERERLGNVRTLERLPPGEREFAQELRDVTVDDLAQAHGFRSEKQAQEAATNILPHILQFARGARPNEPVSEVLLQAGRAAWAQSHFPSYYSHLDYQKLLADPNATPDMLADAKQAADYWNAVRQVLSRYGGEIAPSEVGRAFRSMRNLPAGVVEEVAGGSGVGDVPTNRAKITPREKQYQDMMAAMRRSRKGGQEAQTPEQRAQHRAENRVAGKRPNGPLDAMGLEWDDVMQATGDRDTDLTKMMAGLEDIGGYRMLRDWMPRLMQLDLDDAAGVTKFWTEARAAGGLDEAGLPLVRFSPNVSGQSYLGGADTLTKAQALKLVSRELIKAADEATTAVRQARADGAPPAELKSLEDTARRAYERMGLTITRWDGNGPPIAALSRAAESLRARIEKEWPADRPQTGKPSGMEQVEKKRQLLGLFDQEMKKEQRLLGFPVQGIADLLSFGTSNVLMTARFAQASTLESLLSAINEPFQTLLKGTGMGGGVRVAGQQLRGMARAVGLPSSDDLMKLGEGIKAPALANAMKALRDIGPMESAEDLREVARRGAGSIKSDSPNALARNLSPMHRVSRAISEAFHTINYMGEVNRLVQMASETGKLPGGRRIERVLDEATNNLRNPTLQELFGNLPQEIVDTALRSSRKVTEGGEVGRIEKMVGQWKGLMTKPDATGPERAQGIFGNLLFPFVYGLRPMIRMGTGVLQSPVKHPYEIGKALLQGDTSKAAYETKKFALATTFNSYMVWQVMGGNVTGHGPSDPDDRQALMEATDENGDPIWRPDSFRIPNPGGGHTWVKYTSLPGPIPIIATVMGNMYDAYVFEGKAMESTPELASRMAAQIIPSYFDNTYFRDMMNLVEAFGAPNPVGAVGRLAGQMAGRFVPAAGALRTAATTTDPYQRLTTNPLEEAAAGVPGLRQQLPARVSAFTGEPTEVPINPLTALGGLAGNIYGSPSRPNPLARETSDLGRRAMPWEPNAGQRITPSPGPTAFTGGEQGRGRTFAGQPQTGEAIRGAQQVFGRESGQQASALLSSSAYQRMTPQQKAQALEATFSRATEQSRYAAEGAPGVQLSPQRAYERGQEGIPRYIGVTGSPGEIAEMNARITQARELLSRISQTYGREMAEVLLAQQSPEMWKLATMYPPVGQDEHFWQEIALQQEQGFQPQGPESFLVPDYAGGGLGGVIPGLPAGQGAQALPPSSRRYLS